MYLVTLTSGSSYAWSVPDGASITAGASGPNNNQINVTFGHEPQRHRYRDHLRRLREQPGIPGGDGII